MKRLGILLTLLFLVTGCGQNYSAEKAFWKANRNLQSIPSEAYTEATDLFFLNPIIDEFYAITDKFPSTPKAAESLFVVANLRLKQQDLGGAIEALNRVVIDFGGMKTKVVEALNGIAKLREMQGDWKEAEKIYWGLANDNPLEAKALYAPVHIMIHYKRTGDPEGEQRAYAAAMDYYERYSEEVGPIKAAGVIYNYHALALLMGGEWKQARDKWLKIAEQFQDSPYAPLGYLAAAQLSWGKANYGDAEEIYLAYLDRFPRHMFRDSTAYRVGNLFREKEDYDKARVWYEKTLKLQKKDKQKLAQTNFRIAQTYQEQGNMEKAEELYFQLEKEYPNTYAVYRIPLMRAVYYRETENLKKMGAILTEALPRYKRLQKEASNPQIADYAQRLQNAAFQLMGNWDGILGNLDIDEGRQTSTYEKGRLNFLKALVVEKKVRDEDRALELYQTFLSEYPSHPFADAARSRTDLLSANPS